MSNSRPMTFGELADEIKTLRAQLTATQAAKEQAEAVLVEARGALEDARQAFVYIITHFKQAKDKHSNDQPFMKELNIVWKWAHDGGERCQQALANPAGQAAAERVGKLEAVAVAANIYLENCIITECTCPAFNSALENKAVCESDKCLNRRLVNALAALGVKGND